LRGSPPLRGGDLPFRYFGKHRRALLKDVLALKSKLDKRQTAMEALAQTFAARQEEMREDDRV
jgi:hypothetical protein